LAKGKVIKAVRDQRKRLAGLAGNDSVLTLFLETDLPPNYFGDITTEHIFYTADKVGQSKAGEIPLEKTQEEIKKWLDKYFSLTTYEISIPALRDPEMAPAGKTGLIVSVLFDYRLIRHIKDQDWYAELKEFCTRKMIEVLDTAIYPGLEASITHSFVSTPLTFERMFGNYQGAITGWSFTNSWMPSESRMLKIANSVNTLVPDVYQAGQWTYSPSGFPISILTGKMAAYAVSKKLK
jgi:phytoene dehydrogenase-like protein